MMKLVTGLSFLVLLSLVSCSDFLQEVSQNQVKPSMVSDLEQILLGEGYLDDHNIYDITDIFTDAYTCNGITESVLQEEFDAKKWRYMWSDKMFMREGGGDDSRYWVVPYQGIGTCNVVLDELDKMEGDADLRENIRGEALVLRAWYYFQLVNLFGLPYNYGDPENNPAIPLKLDSGVTDEKFARNSVAEVYEQIEKDLLEGNRLLEGHDFHRNYFRIGHLAAKAILSRTYLYMENWDQALFYADEVLKVKSDLLDLNKFSYDLDYDMAFETVYGTKTTDEVIWMRKFGETDKFDIVKGGASNRCPYSLSPDVINLFGTSYSICIDGELKDLRGVFFLAWAWDLEALYRGDDFLYPLATVKDSGLGKYQGIRTSEVYLNRAEAYCHKFLKEGKDEYRIKALADLNHLRRYRFNQVYTYDEVNITKGDELLAFCLDERCRELTGETNHRWFDMRRNGMPEVVHSYFIFPSDAKQEYRLTKDRYVLPIPAEAIRVNPGLEQNH